MEFRDLRKQYEVLKTDIDKSVSEVLAAGKFISGPQVTELEHALATYTDTKHCITCANGTDALTLALMVWKVGPGDAVFVPDFTFFASGEAPAYEGGKGHIQYVPRFVGTGDHPGEKGRNIDSESYCSRGSVRTAG